MRLLLLGTVILLSRNLLWADEWHKVETPHFTVIAQGRAAAAREWATWLNEFQICMQQVFPVDEARLEPVLVVVFRNAQAFRPYKSRQLMRDSRDLAGMFYRGQGRNLIAMQGDADMDLVRRLIFHEATHWFTSALPHRHPIWVEEGLAELFSTFEHDKGKAIVGGDKVGRLNTLEGYGFIPVRDVIGASSSMVHGAASADMRVFYAQVWLMMNYLMVDAPAGGFAALARYLELTRAGIPDEQAFRQAFNQGYEEFETRLDKYYNARRFGSMSIKLKAPPTSSRLKSEPASAVDLDSALAFLLIKLARTDEAEVFLRRLQAQFPDDPRVYEGLAEVEQQRDNRVGMLHWYAMAAAKGSGHFLAHFYPQHDRVQSMIGGVAVIDRYDPLIVRQTVDSLKETIRLRPAFFPAYEALAGLVGSLAEISETDHAVLLEGVARFPAEPALRLGLVAYDLQHGRVVTAKRTLDELLPQLTGWSVRYAGKLMQRVQTAVHLGWLEKHLAEGKYEEAGRLLASLNRLPMSPAERRHHEETSMRLSAANSIALLRRAIAARDWDLADLAVDQLKTVSIPDHLAPAYDTLVKELEGQRR